MPCHVSHGHGARPRVRTFLAEERHVQRRGGHRDRRWRQSRRRRGRDPGRSRGAPGGDGPHRGRRSIACWPASPSRSAICGVTGVDLTDPADCAALVEQVLQRFGRIDGLVNTVGTFAMAGIDAADPAHWEFLFQVNLSTTLNMCRAVVPSMRAAGRGSIVNIGAAAAARRRQAGMVGLRRLQERRPAPDREPGRRAQGAWRARQLRPAQHHRHAAEPGRDAQGRHRPMGDARRRSPRWSRSCSSDAGSGVNGRGRARSRAGADRPCARSG